MIIPFILMIIIMVIMVIRARDAGGIPSLLFFPCSLAHFQSKWTTTHGGHSHHGVNDYAGVPQESLFREGVMSGS